MVANWHVGKVVMLWAAALSLFYAGCTSHQGGLITLGIIAMAAVTVVTWRWFGAREGVEGRVGTEPPSLPTGLLHKRISKNAVARGSPNPPWDVIDSDYQAAERIAGYFAEHGLASHVIRAKGDFGATLEIVPAQSSGGTEPVAIISRLWDMDERTMVSLLVPGGVVEGPLEALIIGLGYKRVVHGAPGLPFSPFVRK